jgi:hypothetical protein
VVVGTSWWWVGEGGGKKIWGRETRGKMKMKNGGWPVRTFVSFLFCIFFFNRLLTWVGLTSKKPDDLRRECFSVALLMGLVDCVRWARSTMSTKMLKKYFLFSHYSKKIISFLINFFFKKNGI